MVVFPAIVGSVIAFAISQLGVEYVSMHYNVLPEAVLAFEVAPFLISSITLLQWYLETGFKRETELDQARRETEERAERDRLERERAVASESRRLDAYENSLIMMQGDLAQLRAASVTPSIDEKELMARLSERILNKAPDSVIADIKKKIESGFVPKRHLKDIASVFSENSSRMRSELSALVRRGNLNLLFGSGITIFGLTILGMFILNGKYSAKDTTEFLLYFILKVTLVIFIQTFAYFFLKLYRTSLEEIKYLNNELTTIEQRYIALILAANVEAAEPMNVIIGAFAATERNPTSQGRAKEDAERERALLNTGLEAVKALVPAAAAKS